MLHTLYTPLFTILFSNGANNDDGVCRIEDVALAVSCNLERLLLVLGGFAPLLFWYLVPIIPDFQVLLLM